jgi:hypothetical protein
VSSSQAQPPLEGSATEDRSQDDQLSPTDGWPDRTPPGGEVGALPEPDTGHPRVDEAVARMAELDSLPTAEHAAVYEDADRRLHGALTELDNE